MYNPSDWYWSVGGDQAHFWSSARAAYVIEADPDFRAWLDQGGVPTPIDSETSLRAVLDVQFPAGWPGGAKRYVPIWQARERLEAAGKWDMLVSALNTPENAPKLIKLLSLRDGLDPLDAEVVGLLTAIGADPATILAP